MGTLGQIHHIELYVSDLERSTEFWGWFLGRLGYSEFQKWDKGISFKLDFTYLVFVQTDSKYLDVRYHRCRTGLNHIAFHAESRAQVDLIALELRNKGITRLYQDKHPRADGPNSHAIFFEDPDRIKVELVAPCESS